MVFLLQDLTSKAKVSEFRQDNSFFKYLTIPFVKPSVEFYSVSQFPFETSAQFLSL